MILSLLGLGIGVFQADQARKKLVKVAQKELVKYLSQVAQEQSPKVADAIKECFNTYEKEISTRMNQDIQSRKAELDNLVEQKQSVEINQGAEIARLQKLEADVAQETTKVEYLFQHFSEAINMATD